MDKSWINESRVSSEYEVGVKQFLDFAFDHVALSGMIPCPCKNCNNVWNHPQEVVLEHLICYGFDQGYARITWGLHGETTPPSSPNELLDEDEHCDADDMHGMLNGAFGIFNADGVPLEEPNAEAARFYKLMEDAEQELYPGCKKFSKLSFIVRLFHIKCLNGWDLFNMRGEDSTNDGDTYLDNEPLIAGQMEVDVDNVNEVRVNVPGTTIDEPLILDQPMEEENRDDVEVEVEDEEEDYISDN